MKDTGRYGIFPSGIGTVDDFMEIRSRTDPLNAEDGIVKEEPIKNKRTNSSSRNYIY